MVIGTGKKIFLEGISDKKKSHFKIPQKQDATHKLSSYLCRQVKWKLSWLISHLLVIRTSLVAQTVKHLPIMWETQV